MCILYACKDTYGPVSLNNNEIIYTSKGVFVINEGNYMAGNGSLSYYDINSQKLTNEIFELVNNRPLCDVVQSMCMKDSLGFIIVNYSKKIEVININSYQHIATITGFESPRYMQIIDDHKAYVTDLASNKIAIVDVSSFQIVDFIDVNCSTESMLLANSMAFVLNWSYGNKVLVIDTNLDELVDSIVVTKEPNSMIVDKNNKLWVLSSGGFLNDEMPALTRINTENYEIEKVIQFSDISMNPFKLNINGGGDSLYFLNNGIYLMSIQDEMIPEQALISSQSKSFYGLSVHPERSLLFAGDALDFNQNGIVWIYKTDGTAINHFTAGINPSGFYFK